jgi:hypothetical protein
MNTNPPAVTRCSRSPSRNVAVDLVQNCSAGSACVTLEPGEVVSLQTLFRGMMYPSGNDAAWAESTSFPFDEAGVAPLGTAGVMSALRAADGTVRLVARDARRNADNSISPDQTSQPDCSGSV